MAGRQRIGREYYEEPRVFRDGPPPRLARERSISPRRFEGELPSRRGELRRIRDDNQHLVDEIVGLRQAMSRLKEDLHSSSQVIPKLRAEKELESRELTQRNLKLEAELRSLEPLRQDALQLRSEAGSLESLRQELNTKVQGLTKELEQQSSENQRIPAMIAERDDLRQELIRARAALDYEKNAKPELMAQVQAVEKDLVSMAQESEKLRAEIEKRRAPPPRVSGYGAYGPPPGMGVQGMYDSGYNTYTDRRYGTGAGPWDPPSYPRP
ncbi:protein FLX-like 3 [Triticum urartu]|uniref:Protein FLX-like 3 n=1 Tax=Triticum urartu TaxID=4572 RepID=A0A8R7U259_TRIUA|nr:protein FLX-like 3 [Triticum urartu]